MESGAVPKPPRRPLPATVQHPAGRLLPVQRSGGGLVPSELGSALSVTMWGAGLPVQAVVAAGTRGQPLGDVLCVGGGASLTGTTAGDTAERERGGSHSTVSKSSGKTTRRFYISTADGTVGPSNKNDTLMLFSACESELSVHNSCAL